MKFLANATIIASLFWVATACGTSENQDKIKADLDKKKQELATIKSEILELEKQLASLDPEFAKQQDKSVLVNLVTVQEGTFEHKIQVRGNVGSRKNITLSTESMGRILEVPVKEGQAVKAGQVLLRMDGDILSKSLKEMQTSYELMVTLFEKQERLWKQNIGTEIQYLQAKNNKESMEKRMATLKAQLAQTVVKAPFDGVVESVLANVGEMAAPGMPVIALTGSKGMYLQADVSERYLGTFRKGDKAEIEFPTMNKKFVTTINAVGDVIKQENRTFSVELGLPEGDKSFKPNQTAIILLTDYTNAKAVSVPTNYILNDKKGHYVYLQQVKDGNNTAVKRYIERGYTYGKLTEIVSGLKAGEQLITEGANEVVEGVLITLAK